MGMKDKARFSLHLYYPDKRQMHTIQRSKAVEHWSKIFTYRTTTISILQQYRRSSRDYLYIKKSMWPTWVEWYRVLKLKFQSPYEALCRKLIPASLSSQTSYLCIIWVCLFNIKKLAQQFAQNTHLPISCSSVPYTLTVRIKDSVSWAT